MKHAQPKQYFAANQRAVANAEPIEWEELPSLADSLSKRLIQRGSWQAQAAAPRGANDSAFGAASAFQSPWDATMPASLDAGPESQPFREPLDGMVMREVNEPDVFRHFFG
jgi:hypothetical protein